MCAADAASTKVITRAIAEYEGPVYLRLGRTASPKVFDDDYKFTIGKANVLRPNGVVTIIGYGQSISRCLMAADILEAQGISCRVIETPCLKPFDAETVAEAASHSEVIVTVEDHNIIGGLGSAVLETIADAQLAVPCVRLGLKDEYFVSGDPEELLDLCGLRPEDIANAVLKHLNRV